MNKEEKAMKPVIRRNKCTGCKACRDVCPMDMFRMKTGHAFALARKIGDCIGCEECVMSCPSNAIKLGKTRVMRT